MGPALLVKPVVTPEGCLAFALFAWPLLRARRFGPLAGMAAAYAALCAAPTLLVGGLYALRGEFDIWLDSTILAPFTYAAGGVTTGTALYRITMAALALRWLLLMLLPLMLLLGPVRDAVLARMAGFGLLWLAVATVAVAVPGHFFAHYFLIQLPPLALLAATGLLVFARFVGTRRPRVLAFAGVLAVAGNVVATDLNIRLNRGFAMGLPDAPRRMAELMNDELRPGETIFVPNYQPVVYFLTKAPLPTRFPFPVHLTGSFGALAGVDTDAEVARILAARPRFIVLDRSEWFSMRASAMAMLTEALEEHYELAATFIEERGVVELYRLLEPG
jgi:hypothetical protein